MDERDDEGQFKEEYCDEDFLSAVDELPVASTQNVADEVSCSYDLAYRRLQDLEEKGDIEREEVGGSFVWLID
jgi:CTP-dependent riboflavin kinase